MKQLDCRGLACPQPVLNTKDALEESPDAILGVLVDNPAARDNVTRFAKSQGYHVAVTGDEAEFLLTLSKDRPIPSPPVLSTKPTTSPRLVVKISNQYMGSGSDDLGRILMKAFIKSVSEATLKPSAVVFYNSGVYLSCEGSEHLEALKHLESVGVQIFSCGTCLDFFGIKDRLAVGVVTNMFEIIETLSGADRVVAP